MLAPTMTSLPSMTTARPISSMMRLASVGGLELAGAVAVEDDELVAAPARDQIARADDAAQSGARSRPKACRRSVAEAVVDLLEVVEIEKHHGQTAVARTTFQSPGEFLFEAAAVREFGDRVEMRHPVDPDRRVAAFGHVLDNQDRAVVLHAIDRGFDCPAVPGVDRHGHVGRNLGAAEERADRGGELRLRKKLRPDMSAKQRMDALPGDRHLLSEPEDGAELIVHEDEPPGPVDHAQPVRHVVEGRVEAPGKHRGLLLRGDDAEEIRPQAG